MYGANRLNQTRPQRTKRAVAVGEEAMRCGSRHSFNRKSPPSCRHYGAYLYYKLAVTWEESSPRGAPVRRQQRTSGQADTDQTCFNRLRGHDNLFVESTLLGLCRVWARAEWRPARPPEWSTTNVFSVLGRRVEHPPCQSKRRPISLHPPCPPTSMHSRTSL